MEVGFAGLIHGVHEGALALGQRSECFATGGFVLGEEDQGRAPEILGAGRAIHQRQVADVFKAARRRALAEPEQASRAGKKEAHLGFRQGARAHKDD